MARTTRTKKKKEVQVPDEPHDSAGFFSSMSPETLRGIAGVSLFVLAILLLLSSLGLAGIAGEKAFAFIFSIVGVGYWILPLILMGASWSLFTNGGYNKNTLRTIRAVGALFFFLSVLGIVAIIAPDRFAGSLGVLIETPLVRYLDTIASIVILAGTFIISLLLLFDSELWIVLFRKVRSMVTSTHTEDDAVAEDALTEAQEAFPEHAQEVLEADQSEPAYVPEEDYVLPPEAPPATSSQKEKRREPVFQLPSEYTAPPLSLLEGDRGKVNSGDTKIKANVIRKTLQHFKIPVEMDEVVVGPSVTRYSLKPAAGVKLSKIVTLQPNLELALAASPIRIEAPIPGKSLVGIEVPNAGKSFVGLSGLLASPEFSEETVPLFVALGKDITGSAHYANIGKMPHLLVAGTTGSGKSVMIHSIITSLLYRNGPERLRFILVDPKRVELTLYNDIPHLLTPVITEAKKCILSLKWVADEMERRYDTLSQHKLQDISGYHAKVIAPAHAKLEKAKEKGEDTEGIDTPEPMPHIVVIIDELADIMASYPKELEAAIVRLAQKSRAVGIHLVLSTQRPSAQVITGLIKANIPTRIALKVSSLLESRIILDQGGAEKLLGAGDMLYLSSDMAKPRRIQSPFLTTEEVRSVVSFIYEHNDQELPSGFNLTNGDGTSEERGSIPFDRMEATNDLDELYEDVKRFVITEKRASTSVIQRRFKVGYGRAARIMDQLEAQGVITPSDGTNKPRTILHPDTDYPSPTMYEEEMDEDEDEQSHYA